MNVSDKRGFTMEIPSYKNENLTPRLNAINKEIKQILRCHQESKIRARHFSFIDFKKHGINWRPEWFSVVRHPIKRVCVHIEHNWGLTGNIFLFFFGFRFQSWSRG